MAEKTDRRSFLNKTLLGAAGVGAAASLEENILLAAVDQGQASPQEGQALPQPPKPDVDPASMPCGKIGKVTVSRLFLGGNLIGGWSHSRDLIYVSKLFKSYNTEAKIFETLALAEAVRHQHAPHRSQRLASRCSSTSSAAARSRRWSASRT